MGLIGELPLFSLRVVLSLSARGAILCGLGTKYQVTSTKYQVPGTGYQVQVPGAEVAKTPEKVQCLLFTLRMHLD